MNGNSVSKYKLTSNKVYNYLLTFIFQIYVGFLTQLFHCIICSTSLFKRINSFCYIIIHFRSFISVLSLYVSYYTIFRTIHIAELIYSLLQPKTCTCFPPLYLLVCTNIIKYMTWGYILGKMVLKEILYYTVKYFKKRSFDMLYTVTHVTYYLQCKFLPT